MMIPVNEPLFTKRERELVCECVDTGWVSSEGRFVEQFEEMVAGYVGVKYGIAVSSGTAALEVAVAALGLEPGDKIIMPSFTIISCALSAIRNGLRPVLVDVEPETWNMDVQKVQELFEHRAKSREQSGRIKAIMPVHIYGHPCDMDPLLKLADAHGLYVIEDAAEIQGAEYKGRKCGSDGHLATFSFYANKIVTTGEGGMVVTDDDGLAERARSLRNLCFQRHPRFVHEEMGYNFRLTNLQAALGVAQMERIDALVSRKIQQGVQYRERLKHVKGIRLQDEKDWANPVYWVNGIVLEDDVPIDAVELANLLRDKGVQTRPFFWPLHEQPVFRKMDLFFEEKYPVSERLARRGLYLPSGMALKEEHISSVCSKLIDCLEEVASLK